MNAVYDDHYGIKPMGLDEHLALPAPVRQTRNNKVNLVNTLDHIEVWTRQLREITKRIPEDNDQCHADLVELLVQNVKRVEIDISTAQARSIAQWQAAERI